MKKWIYLVTSLVLIGCPICDEAIIIENGSLPASALKLVPYQRGKTYKLKHSNGLIINFETARETRDKKDSHCHGCCEYEYHFKVNSTWLIPDYPMLNCYFEISNKDTTRFDCYASIGRYEFYIPTSGTQQKADSLIFDSTTYYDVFKLKSNYDSYYHKDSIYADSLFYNFHYGILKILMSNGEYYEIVQ